MLNNRTRSRLAAGLVSLLLLVTGCQQAPDCAEAVNEATALGSQGQLASFDETRFDEACRADYLAAWEAATNAYCEPTLAFERALGGDLQPPACNQPAYLRNHQLGANLYALTEEKQSIETALAAGENDGTDPAQLQVWRMRLRVLEREIPELETIARMRGLMAPAELPPEIRDDANR